jgi:hypothetical protein
MGIQNMKVIVKRNSVVSDKGLDKNVNILPSWNDNMLYYNPKNPEDVNNKAMNYIINRHTTFGRFNYLIYNDESRKKILTKFPMTKDYIKMLNDKLRINQVLTEREALIVNYGLVLTNMSIFPYEMTIPQIVGAIKKAYNNARKIDIENVTQTDHDNLKVEDNDNLIASLHNLYKGNVDNLEIRFAFDFESKQIITAYPIYRNI